MRIALIHLVAAAPLMLLAPAALAQGSDPVASSEIDRGAYREAERKLDAALRTNPDRPELLLNMAAVYGQTGRPAEARVLYQRVLGQRDVLMDVSKTRTAGSHALARAGIARLDRQAFARR